MQAERARESALWFGRPECRPALVEDERPAEGLYQLIGSRWVAAVLRELNGDAVRYNALHRRLGGVSHKMLTQTLRRLERADMVHRHATSHTPPNVEYLLTSAGTELVENLSTLERWADAKGLPY